MSGIYSCKGSMFGVLQDVLQLIKGTERRGNSVLVSTDRAALQALSAFVTHV